jgi:hypothetical protein
VAERAGCVFATKVLSINDRLGFSVNRQVKTLVHESSRMLLREGAEDDDLELVVESIPFTVSGSLGRDRSSCSVPLGRVTSGPWLRIADVLASHEATEDKTFEASARFARRQASVHHQTHPVHRPRIHGKRSEEGR